MCRGQNKKFYWTHDWAEPLEQTAHSVTYGGAIVIRDVKICRRCGKISKFVLNVSAKNLSESHYDPIQKGKCPFCKCWGIFRYEYFSNELCTSCNKNQSNGMIQGECARCGRNFWLNENYLCNNCTLKGIRERKLKKKSKLMKYKFIQK